MTRSRNVYHMWAQGNDGYKRIGNCSYRNDTAYSYAAPIARLVRDKKGKIVAAFITDKTYSVTTARHIGQVRAASSQYSQFVVPHLLDLDKQKHIENYEELVTQARDLLQRAARARGNSQHYYTMAGKALSCANEYSKLFGLRRKSLDVESVKAAAAAAAEKEKEAEAKRKRTREKALLSAIREFKIGGPILSVLRELPSELLRVSGDELQTSKGVSIPLSEATPALARLREIAAAGNDWRENGEQITISAYRVNSYIADKQTFIAGCHKIKFETIETLAKELGL